MKHSSIRRGTRLAAGAFVILALAAACGNSGDEASGKVTNSPTASAAGGGSSAAVSPSTAVGELPSGDASQPAPAGNGCPSNSAQIPAGAHKTTTADVDLDGKPDTLWIGEFGSKRTVGITTATGATFSTNFQSAAPQPGVAQAQKLAPAGPAIILLDFSRSVQLFDVVDCSIVPTKNAQGEQYTFDRGFTGYGSGVQCVKGSDGYTLFGTLAKPNDSGASTFKVTRTAITLSDFGRKATNGATQTLATKAAPDSTEVRQAQAVSCGTGTHVNESQP